MEKNGEVQQVEQFTKMDLWNDYEWLEFYKKSSAEKNNIYDSTVGCMNRMCVCDKEEELNRVFKGALNNLIRLHTINQLRLSKQDEIIGRRNGQKTDN